MARFLIQIAKNAMMCIADLCITLPDLVPLDGIVRQLANTLSFPLPLQPLSLSVLRALHPPLSSAPQAAHFRGAVDRIVLVSAR